MPIKTLITAPAMLADLDTLGDDFAAAGIDAVAATGVEERLSEPQLLPQVGDIEATICGDDAWSAAVLDAAPKLKVIAKWGTGVDSIDRAAAAARGIAVINVPDAFVVPVAESALQMMLAFARSQPWQTRAMRQSGWAAAKLAGTTLGESTIGIIGVGRIGQRVATLCHAFGATLLGNDPVTPPDGFLQRTRLRMAPLDELLAASDFVTLHCDLNDTSRGLIDAAALGRMKPTAVLVNAARGPVVDEPALIAALRAGKIAGAGLDVFVDEPITPAHPLCQMGHVLLSPHNTNSSPAAYRRVHLKTMANVREGLGS